MKFILLFFYTSGIYISDVMVYAGSFFSQKLALLYKGRKMTLQKLRSSKCNLNKPVWVHCASLGEFEQGRPLIEKIKQNYPHKQIVISFFSPSGFEIRKNYPFADEVIYLLSDTPAHVQIMINAIDPDAVIFVKYEFWWNLIDELINARVPVFLISGVFRKDNYFLNPIFASFLHILKNYTAIFVQDESSYTLLKHHGMSNIQIAGDTRIDSVRQKASAPGVDARIKKLTSDKTTIVYGSVWMTDILVVNAALTSFDDFVHIIAPHDISDKNIAKIQGALVKKSVLFSADKWDHNILLIDNIGMLSGIYSTAKYAYIGGGFQKGIHNILEPAVFRIPVFIGPAHKKFVEAVAMVDQGMAFEVSAAEDMVKAMQRLEKDNNYYKEIQVKIDRYMETNSGATDKILQQLSGILAWTD